MDSDLVNGIPDCLFTHDCSFPGALHAEVAVGSIKGRSKLVPIAVVAIENSRWPTLIASRRLLLVVKGGCREDRIDAGLCSVRKPAPPASPARSACRI